jgi:hypothetical protein
MKLEGGRAIVSTWPSTKPSKCSRSESDRSDEQHI